MAFADQDYDTAGQDTAGQDYDTDLGYGTDDYATDDLYGAANQIREGVALLGAAASSFDARYYSGDDAARLISILTEGENFISSMKMQCAIRVEDTHLHEQQGYRDAGALISELTGEPVGKARGALELGHQIQENPEIAEVFKKGKLSGPKAKEIAEAAQVDPETTAELLEHAEQMNFGQLKSECQKVKRKALNDSDSETRWEKMRSERYFRSWIDADGFGRIDAKVMPDALETIKSAIGIFEPQIREEARAEGIWEKNEQYLADALVRAAKTAIFGSSDPASSDNKGTKPRVILRLRASWNAIVRGYTEGDEFCEIDGGGAIPPSLAVEYAKDALLELVITKGTKIDTIVTNKRGISNALRIGLEERDRTCSHKGCGVSFPLEIDHDIEFSKDGPTSYENCRRVCGRHHDLKTFKGWRWVGEPGNMRLVPPDKRPGRPQDGSPPQQ
jgi:Domain of unknown function (DUF222)